jgi:hypothetical protein
MERTAPPQLQSAQFPDGHLSQLAQGRKAKRPLGRVNNSRSQIVGDRLGWADRIDEPAQHAMNFLFRGFRVDPENLTAKWA